MHRSISLAQLQLLSPITPTIRRRSQRPASAGSPRPHLLLARSGGEAVEPLPLGTDEAVAGLLGVRVEELLLRKENQPLLEGLEATSRRAERARAALADIEMREAEALRAKQLVHQLQILESEITETQKEILEARAMVEESERSLSSGRDEKRSDIAQNEVVTKELERWESIKAASISSIVGTLASLPISLYQATSYTELSLHTAIIFIGSALFGVTFRYTVRSDIDNFQLKTGISAAFGFVKGLAEVEAGNPLELNFGNFVSHTIDGAMSVSENIFIFLASAIALDFCFKMRLLTPFPIRD